VAQLVELLRTDRAAAAAALAIPTSAITEAPTQGMRAQAALPPAPAIWRLALTTLLMVVLGVIALQLLAWRRADGADAPKRPAPTSEEAGARRDADGSEDYWMTKSVK
jgi:hypothetical protein